MSSSAWAHLDWALAIVETLLVPISLALLAGTMGRRRMVTPALVSCVIVAATLAQPFGVRAIPISPEEFVSGDPVAVRADAVHSASVVGVPLFGFAPYSRRTLYGTDTSASATFKIRSWLWPGLLTNAYTAGPLCGQDAGPCWEPDGPANDRELQLVRSGKTWRYRVLGLGGTPVPTQVNGSGGYYYRLAVGITSPAGVVYWLILIAAVVAHRRRRPSGEPEPVASV